MPRGQNLTKDHQSSAGRSRWLNTTTEKRAAQLAATGVGMLSRASELVQSWPPLTPEQVERLRALLPPLEVDGRDS